MFNYAVADFRALSGCMLVELVGCRSCAKVALHLSVARLHATLDDVDAALAQAVQGAADYATALKLQDVLSVQFPNGVWMFQARHVISQSERIPGSGGKSKVWQRYLGNVDSGWAVKQANKESRERSNNCQHTPVHIWERRDLHLCSTTVVANWSNKD